MHKHLEKICDIKHKLIEGAEMEVGHGLNGQTDLQGLGQVIDMIKDLAVAEEKCVKAAYYDILIAEDGEPDEGKMGYNPRRYASGRYAPRGMGSYGYTPYGPRMMDLLRTDEYNHEYAPMGYYPSGEGNRSQSGSRFGYMDGNRESGRYGYSYNEYRNARRNYTQSHSDADKKAMDEHANEHVADTIASMRDIWENADRDHKVRMKQDLTNLVNEMTI